MTTAISKKILTLETLPGIKKIVMLERASSTQEVARELALHGDMENTLVIALTQDCGKGRMGRVWESGPGGIYMTLILQPCIGLRFLADLSLLAGRVTADTLQGLYGISTRVKLPNDVYALHPRKNKYLKIAGVLTGSSSINKTSNWILLGIGVNLNNRVPLDTAVSVSSILRKEVSLEEFLQAFFKNFWHLYSAWEYSSESKSV